MPATIIAADAVARDTNNLVVTFLHSDGAKSQLPMSTDKAAAVAEAMTTAAAQNAGTSTGEGFRVMTSDGKVTLDIDLGQSGVGGLVMSRGAARGIAGMLSITTSIAAAYAFAQPGRPIYAAHCTSAENHWLATDGTLAERAQDLRIAAGEPGGHSGGGPGGGEFLG